MRSIAIIAAMFATLAAGTSAAQDRERARAAFADAETQFAEGNYQLALEGWEESYLLMEGDRRAQILILFNIGRARQSLGRNADALDAFTRFLEEAPADAEQRPAAVDLVRDLRARVDAGDVGPRGAGDNSGMLFAGIGVAGLGGATLIASIATGVLALDAEGQLAVICTEGGCPSSAQSTIDDAHTLSIATDALWIAGASIAVVGGALIGIAIGTQQPLVGAACTQDGCAATLRGRF